VAGNQGNFLQGIKKVGGEIGIRNESRLKRRESAIWQSRYWEHQLRDEEDLNIHFDCLHSNPSKRGLVKRMRDWLWSSYVRKGYYSLDWRNEREVFLGQNDVFCE